MSLFGQYFFEFAPFMSGINPIGKAFCKERVCASPVPNAPFNQFRSDVGETFRIPLGKGLQRLQKFFILRFLQGLLRRHRNFVVPGSIIRLFLVDLLKFHRISSVLAPFFYKINIYAGKTTQWVCFIFEGFGPLRSHFLR